MTLKAKGLASLADVHALERDSLDTSMDWKTTYEALQSGTSIAPNEPAITFFLDAKKPEQAHVQTHAELLSGIHRYANTFHRLGIQRTDVVAYVLPNLPETFAVIWGGQAAGIVLAINPMIDAKQMGQLMRAANAKVLVTLEPTPKTDIWQKASHAAKSVPSLRTVLVASFRRYLSGFQRAGLWGYGILNSSKEQKLD